MASGVELATAYVSISASTGGLGRQISRAMGAPEIAAAGETAGKSISSRMGSVLKKSAVGVGVAAGGVLATSLFKGWSRLTNIENATKKLEGLGHSARTVRGIMDNALASVKGTAFGLDEAATTSAAVVAAGIKPGKDLERVLKTVADTATIAGTSMGDMGAIFGSVAARGKLQGDDLLQLQSRGVPVLAMLAKHYGVTAAEASKMVTKGEVDFQNFADAMHENLGGAALKSGETTQGAFKNMTAALGRFGATLLKGVFPLAKTVFGGITTLLDDLGERVGPFVEKFSLSVLGIRDRVVNALKDIGPDVKAAAADFWSGLTMDEATRAEFDGQTSGLVAFGGTVRRLFDAIKEAARKAWPGIKAIWDALKQASKDIGVSTWSLFVLALEGIAAALEWAAPYIAQFADWVEKNPDKVKAFAVGLVTFAGAMKIANLATTGLGLALKGIGLILSLNPWALAIAGIAALGYWFIDTQGKGDTFKDKFLDVWDQIKQKVQAVVDWFQSFWDAHGAAIKANWDEIWGQVKDTFTSVWDSIKAIASVVGEWLSTFWRNWGGTIQAYFAGTWANIKLVFSGALDVIKGLFNIFAGLFTADWGRLWDGVKQVFSGQWKILRGVVGQAFESLKLLLSTAWAAIRTVAERAWSGIVSAVGSIWRGIVEAVSGPIRRVMQFIQENFIDKINGLFRFLGMSLYIKPIWTAASGRPQHDSWAKGFSAGGYTGNKPVNQVAGVVHGREFVLNAGSTARIMRQSPGFLESLNGYKTGGYVNPVGRPPSFPWGAYPSGGVHRAYDYAVPVGTPVHAPYAARVIAAGWDSTGFGLSVRTQDSDGAYSIFGHLSSLLTSVGQLLRLGQVLGLSGSTGRSTGPHLHWERRRSPYDPSSAFNPDGGGRPGSGGSPIKDFVANIIRSGIEGFTGVASSGLSHLGWIGSVVAALVKKLGTGAANLAIRALGLDVGGQVAEVQPELYDQGGLLRPGLTLVANQTGQPERVLPPGGSMLTPADLQMLVAAVREGVREGAVAGMDSVTRTDRRLTRMGATA